MNRFDCFNEIVFDCMHKNEISKKILHEMTGISLSRIYDFSKKVHFPSLSNAIKICGVFRCSLDYIFGFVEIYKPKDYIIADCIANRVQDAIKKSGKTRHCLAEKLGVAESQLSNWINGKQIPSLLTIIALAEQLGCSVDYLAGRE